MKKQICFLVVFILTVLSILTIDLPVYAENSGIRIYYESQNVQKGDIVSIPISVQNNSGIMGLGLEIHYDKNVFEIQSLTKGGVLEKGIFNTSLQEGTDPAGNIKVLWSNTDIVKLNGTLMVLTLKIKDTASGGQYKLGIVGSEGDTFDADYKDLSVLSSCGDINVVAADAMIVSSKSDEVLGGSEIAIPVSFVKNTGIMGFKISVSYNGAILNTPEVERGELLTAGTFNNSITESTDSGFDILWSNTENITEDGVAFYLKFKTNLVAELSDAEIKLTYSQPDTFNESFDDVNLAIQPCSLKILSSKELDDYKEAYEKDFISDFDITQYDESIQDKIGQVIKEAQDKIKNASSKGEITDAIEEARHKIDEISNKENEKVELRYISGLTGVADVVQKYAVGTKIILPDSIFTRNGYILNGWLNRSEKYDIGTAFTIPDSDVALTALWEKKAEPTPAPVPTPDPTPTPNPTPTTPASTSIYTYEVLSDGTIRITSCQTSDVNLVIPDTIDGYMVTEIGANAFANQTSIQTVRFPANLKQIGVKAFANCTGLLEVTLPDTIQGAGQLCFSGCTALKKAVLNKGRINIVYGMFENCTSLTEVVIPDTVENIAMYAFLNCRSLTHLNLPASLKSISVHAFEGAGVTTITYAGTKAQWQKVKKNLTGNGSFVTATVTDSTGVSFAVSGSNNGNQNPQQTVKKPGKVKITKAKNVKTKKLTVKWKKTSKAKGYQIQIASNKKFTKGKKTKTLSKTIYSFKKLKKNKYYYVRVRAYVYNSNHKKVYGSWSTVKKVKIKK